MYAAFEIPVSERTQLEADGASIIIPNYLILQAGELVRLGAFLDRSGGTSLVLGDRQLPLTSSAILQQALAENADQCVNARIVRDIRNIHTNDAFSAHLATLKDQASPHCKDIPRLRDLILSETMKIRQQDVIESFLSNFDGDISESLDPDHLYKIYFEREYFSDCAQDEMKLQLKSIVKDSPRELIRLAQPLERGPIGHPDLHQHFLRFTELLNAGRYFDRVVRNCLHLLKEDVTHAIRVRAYDLLWFAQYRLGAYSEAHASVEKLIVLEPHSRRALVNRAIAVEAVEPDRFLSELELSNADFGQSTVPGNILYAEKCIDLGELGRAERAIRSALTKDGSGRLNSNYLLTLHNIYIGRSEFSEYLNSYLKRNKIYDQPDPNDLMKVSRPETAFVESQGLVSIVMTAFDAGTYIEQSIEAIQNQTYQDFELILIDDCSSDDTVERIVRMMENDNRLLLIKNEKNIGTYAGKNRGIRQARGEYIALCDSDDIWLSDHLACHVAAMIKEPDCMVSTSRWMRLLESGRVELGLRGNYVEVCPHSTFFRREVFNKVGYFDAVRFGADREFLTRVSLHYGSSAYREIDRVATFGRRHGASLTSSGTGAIQHRLFSPVRLQYWKSWNDWHLASVRDGALPYTSGEIGDRPFDVPDAMNPAL